MKIEDVVIGSSYRFVSKDGPGPFDGTVWTVTRVNDDPGYQIWGETTFIATMDEADDPRNDGVVFAEELSPVD